MKLSRQDYDELIRRRPELAPHRPDIIIQPVLQTPKLELCAKPKPLAKAQVQKDSSKRILIRIVSVRKRLLDEDNLCEKFLVDCLRYAGIIPGDSPEQVKIETVQRRCAKGEMEETFIEITPSCLRDSV